MVKNLLKKLTLLLVMLVGVTSSWAGSVTDVISATDLAATGTTYTDFSSVTGTSGAVYAGQSAKDGSENIQMRSKNSNSGIVSTASGGKLKSIKITVGSGSNTIDVYGSNTAYTAASDLYNSSKQGTKLGSVSATGTITVTGDYEYVGIRSNSGAIYLSSIEIEWETADQTKLDNTITVTGGTSFTIDRTNNEEDLTLTATATSGTAVTFTIDTESTTISDDSYELENGYLLVSGNKSGIIVIKANAEGNDDYKDAPEVTITVNVIGEKDTPVILVENANVAFGSTFTVDDSAIEGGAITVTSGNENVATVDGLVVTPVAVGTTTITVATAENSDYKAGSETFTLTVTAPQGQSTAKVGAITTTFKNKNLSYEEGGIDWTASIAAYSFESADDARGVQFGSGKGKFTLTTQNTDVITKVSMVLSTNAGTNTVSVKVGDTDFKTLSGEDMIKTLTLSNGLKNGTIEFTGTGTGNVVISVDDKTKSVYFKSITLTKEITATLNASGFATFCSLYPVDFTGVTDYSAWQITNIDNDKITFEQITGSVKGGTGIFLKGEAGKTVTLTSADSDNELTGNLLEGILAPTYVAAGKYYGLSGENFVKIKEGNVKAGKAILDADLITSSAPSRFTFVFGNQTTGISEVEHGTFDVDDTVYSLSGQRVNSPKKGMYIVNGKKVMMK